MNQAVTYRTFEMACIMHVIFTMPYFGVGSVFSTNQQEIYAGGNNQPYILAQADTMAVFDYDSDWNRTIMTVYKNADLEDYVDENGNITSRPSDVLYDRVYLGSCYEVHYNHFFPPTYIYYVGGGPETAVAMVMMDTGQIRETSNIFRDHQGSIVDMEDQNGNARHFYYDPWGRPCSSDGTPYANGYVPSEKKFIRGYLSQEYYAEFGLLNLNARLYNPHIGRFLSIDPVWNTSADVFGFNPYIYGNNNPCRYVDPDGKFAWLIANIFIDIVRNVADGNFNIFHFDWTRTENSLKIDLGMFTGSLGQILNKWTWGLRNSFAGNTIAQGLNLVGAVSGVSEMNGMLAIAGPTGESDNAFTIGHYSMGPKNYQATWKDHLFVHEYGHYIQSQQWGPMYIGAIGIPSLISAWYYGDDPQYKHRYTWIERNASKLGGTHFDKRYGSYRDGYQNGSPDFFDIKSFEYGTKSPYKNDRKGNYNYTELQKGYPFHHRNYYIYH